MHRFTRIVIPLVLAAACLAPSGAYAMSTPELQVQLSRCGFETNASGPSSRYVVVRDPGAAKSGASDYRIAMAIVYDSPTAAAEAHRKAHRAAEERVGESWPFSDDNGPQLLAGYGGSVWRSHVALGQTSYRTLAGEDYVDDTGEARIARPELLELGFVQGNGQYAVDRDLVACVDDAAATLLATPPAAGTETIFFPGRPW